MSHTLGERENIRRDLDAIETIEARVLFLRKRLEHQIKVLDSLEGVKPIE